LLDRKKKRAKTGDSGKREDRVDVKTEMFSTKNNPPRTQAEETKTTGETKKVNIVIGIK